uniref:Uncharacterized protein n=1 Tax=Neolamprologus brichardi TaxID=32507 RepID=A0A3Q4HDY8_NEOBR
SLSSTSLERTKPWSFWDKATPKAPEIGAEALGRLVFIIFYPLFSLGLPESRFCTGDDARRQHHGLYAFKLRVDPANFRILAHNIILCMAMFFQEDFTPEVHR